MLFWHTDWLRILDLAAALVAASAALGKIARDVTLLAQSEVAEAREGGAGRGGSSAMPHKNNPVAAVAVLGCTRRCPACSRRQRRREQEHQRAAGAWHSEWEPLDDLLRLTGSAFVGRGTAGGLVVMPADAGESGPGHGLMAEHVAGLLAPAPSWAPARRTTWSLRQR